MSVVTVDFDVADTGTTRVMLTHRGLADAESVARHDHGWQAVLANLDEQVFSGGAR